MAWVGRLRSAEEVQHMRRFTLVLLAASWGCGSQNGSTLDPPPAGQGFQLHVAPFDVGAGVETQRCYFYAIPGTPDQEVWVNRYNVVQPEGSHHMNVFRVNTIENLSGKPEI